MPDGWRRDGDSDRAIRTEVVLVRIDDEARQPWARGAGTDEFSIAANAPVDQVVVSGRDPSLVAEQRDDVVAAVAANQDVVPPSTDQRVAFLFAMIVVVTFVLAVFALVASVLTTFVIAIVMVIVEDAGDQHVVAQAAVEDVAASASDKHIVPGATDQPIVPAAAVQIVVAVATDEGVITAPAEDRESRGHDARGIDDIVTAAGIDFDRRERSVRRLLHDDVICAVPRIEDEALDRRQLENEWSLITA